MAQHWSAYVSGITPKQAYALDRIAAKQGKSSGQSLLCDIAGGISTSGLSRTDAITMRHLIDQAFALPDPEQQVTSAYVSIDGDNRIVIIDGTDYTFGPEKWAAFQAAVAKA